MNVSFYKMLWSQSSKNISSVEFSRMGNMKVGCYSKHVILMISAQPKGKNERNFWWYEFLCGCIDIFHCTIHALCIYQST